MYQTYLHQAQKVPRRPPEGRSHSSGIQTGIQLKVEHAGVFVPQQALVQARRLRLADERERGSRFRDSSDS
jgi:hypothetical protein